MIATGVDGQTDICDSTDTFMTEKYEWVGCRWVILLNVKISHPVVVVMALVRSVFDLTPGVLDSNCGRPTLSPHDISPQIQFILSSKAEIHKSNNKTRLLCIEFFEVWYFYDWEATLQQSIKFPSKIQQIKDNLEKTCGRYLSEHFLVWGQAWNLRKLLL